MKKTPFFLFLLFTSFCVVALAQEDGKIKVTGVGVVWVMPNRSELMIDISSKEERASDALEGHNKMLRKFLRAMLDAGIKEENLSNSQFRVEPFTRDFNKPQNVLFTASSTILIKITDVRKIGEYIDKTIAAGATTVRSPIFSYENEDSLKTVAYEKAVQDAKEKAQNLAESFGVKLGKVLNISVDLYDIQPQYFLRDPRISYMKLSAPSLTETIIMPNSISKQAKIDVVFEIENAKTK